MEEENREEEEESFDENSILNRKGFRSISRESIHPEYVVNNGGVINHSDQLGALTESINI